jgi:hypothetical protein
MARTMFSVTILVHFGMILCPNSGVLYAVFSLGRNINSRHTVMWVIQQFEILRTDVVSVR